MKKYVVSRHTKAMLRNVLKNPNNIQPLVNILSGNLINNIDLTMYGMLCDTKDDFVSSVKSSSSSVQRYHLNKLDDFVSKMSMLSKEAGLKITELRSFPTQEISAKELKSKVFDILYNLDHSLIIELVKFIKVVVEFEEA